MDRVPINVQSSAVKDFIKDFPLVEKGTYIADLMTAISNAHLKNVNSTQSVSPRKPHSMPTSLFSMLRR